MQCSSWCRYFRRWRKWEPCRSNCHLSWSFCRWHSPGTTSGPWCRNPNYWQINQEAGEFIWVHWWEQTLPRSIIWFFPVAIGGEPAVSRTLVCPRPPYQKWVEFISIKIMESLSYLHPSVNLSISLRLYRCKNKNIRDGIRTHNP